MEVGEVEVDGRRMRWCVINVHELPSMKVATKAFHAWHEKPERSVRLLLATDSSLVTNELAVTLVGIADELEVKLASGPKVLLVKQWLERPLRLEQAPKRHADPRGSVWGRRNGKPLLTTATLENRCIGTLSDEEIMSLL